jgi:putative DNA primase/helicase
MSVTARESAKDWLRSILANGPVAVERLRELAERDGISWASVRRAQKSLGIKPRNSGYQGKWSWELPEDRNPAVDLIDNKKE